MSAPIKRLLAKKDLASLVEETAEALGVRATVLDADGAHVYGAPLLASNSASNTSYAISVDGEMLGSVHGSQVLADLISFAAYREKQRKSLTQDGLSRLNELTLLYEVTEKIAHASDPVNVGRIVIDAAKRLISADTVTVFVLTPEERGGEPALATLAAEGELPADAQKHAAVVLSQTLAKGRSEIINRSETTAGGSSSAAEASMLCAPLKRDGVACGAILLTSLAPHEYASQELSLINTLSHLASMALERLQLRESMQKLSPGLRKSAAVLKALATEAQDALAPRPPYRT